MRAAGSARATSAGHVLQLRSQMALWMPMVDKIPAFCESMRATGNTERRIPQTATLVGLDVEHYFIAPPTSLSFILLILFTKD
jgi:hypothetical protein